MPVLGWAFTHLHWLVPNVHTEVLDDPEDKVEEKLEDEEIVDKELVDELVS